MYLQTRHSSRERERRRGQHETTRAPLDNQHPYLKTTEEGVLNGQGVFRGIMRLYFRRIERERIPRDAPVRVLAQNFLDSIGDEKRFVLGIVTGIQSEVVARPRIRPKPLSLPLFVVRDHRRRLP